MEQTQLISETEKLKCLAQVFALQDQLAKRSSHLFLRQGFRSIPSGEDGISPSTCNSYVVSKGSNWQQREGAFLRTNPSSHESFPLISEYLCLWIGSRLSGGANMGIRH